MNSLKLSILGTLAMVGASYGTTINGTSLQTILNDITVGGASSVDVQADQIEMDQYWRLTGSGTSAATMVIEIAGNSTLNSFGIYDAGNVANKIVLFEGGATSGHKATVSIWSNNHVVVSDVTNLVYRQADFTGSTFGYFLQGPGGTFYSDNTLNYNGADKMVSFAGTGDLVQLSGNNPGTWTPNEYILAWEDLGAGADNDFNDMVVMVESVEPIPEPTTMGLMGLGLLGLGLMARRKKA